MNRVWFVTGAARGMGVSIVNAALQQGDRVVATGRNMDKLRQIFSTVAAENIELLELDVRDEHQAKVAVDAAVRRFGRIDVLVNNAGFCLLGRFEEATAEQIELQFATNVFGTANVLRAVLPVMRQQRSGRIINTSSIAGVKAVANATFYSASKFAVEGMTLALPMKLRRLVFMSPRLSPVSSAQSFSAIVRPTMAKKRLRTMPISAMRVSYWHPQMVNSKGTRPNLHRSFVRWLKWRTHLDSCL